MTRHVLFELFVTNLLLFEHQQKTAHSELTVFWDLWRNQIQQWLEDVVNRCLESGATPHSEHRFPALRKDVINQCLEFSATPQ